MVEVTPGYLRPEGPGFRGSDVKRFVESTFLTNFSSDELSSALSFVVSSTEPPATSSRTIATLWFARGEGRLRKWDNSWAISAPSGPTDSAFWVAISDRREMVARWTQFNQDSPGLPRYDPCFSIHIFSSTVTNSFGVERVVMPIAIANTFVPARFAAVSPYTVTGTDDDYFTIVDIGYCTARPATNATGPSFGVATEDSYGLVYSSAIPYNVDVCYWAHIVESGVSFHPATGRVKIFQYGNGLVVGSTV